MPRTKVVKKKQPAAAAKLSPWASSTIEKIENIRKAVNLKLDQDEKNCLAMLRTHLNKTKLSIPVAIANKTLGELAELPPNWSGNNTTSTSVLQILNATKSLTEKKRPVTRSSSFADDEGYLTAESSNGTSGGRKSRARTKTVQKSARVSRSLSTRTTKTGSVERFKTPSQKIPPVSYGTITPKVKPNTPQVLLRRPKQGEVALSLQGSPLLTGNVVTDDVANINIPLNDGRLLSIQPQRGLRISQIPFLDGETKRQLETLRDNLNKVCAISSKR